MITNTFVCLSTLFILGQKAQAAPPLDRRIFGSALDILDSAVLFDVPAFQTPGSNSWTAAVPAFVSTRSISIAPVISAATSLLSSFGVSVDSSQATILADRLQLFASIGLAKKEVDVTVNGCSGGGFALKGTSGNPDLGMILQNVNLGTCDVSKPLTGSVHVSGLLDNRTFTNTIFPSPPTGFGVISDIDDTVKVSHSLDTAATLKATFLEAPVPVTGMPQVYNSLKASLNNPQFMYVSGSPSQLFPFLSSFIKSTYPAGPMFLQNVTLTDVSEIKQLTDTNNIFVYKSAMIDRIQAMYPAKNFLTVGDSTQKDPETYGAAFRKFGGDFIQCIWIRQVDGANNTDARFAAAFDGVPSDRIRLYQDADIPSLANIDVAGGKCQ